MTSEVTGGDLPSPAMALRCRVRVDLLYFAYGSNMSEAQMRERCPASTLLGPARLPDHAIAFTRHSPKWGAGVADVVARAGEAVWGLLYQLTPVCLGELDRREGHPVHYRRSSVRVAHGADLVAAQTYAVVEKVPFVAPSRAYHEIMVRAAERHGFPEAYLETLRAVHVAAG